jgi:cell fate regulator YaaT (PSP1 superfamily)
MLMSRDRRKLTFYFKADKRVDFRDLTKENFRIFKVSISLLDVGVVADEQSRIWMSMVPRDDPRN